MLWLQDMKYKPTKEPLVFSFHPIQSPNTLFLDRDGVLNHVIMRGDEVSSPRSLAEVNIVEDFDALSLHCVTQTWNLIVVSNQPDLSRGTIDVDLLKSIHERIVSKIPINTIYVCPHQRSDHCSCRKPKSGLIQKFRKDYAHIMGTECLVGDRASDFDCATNAGIPFILRKRPYNEDLLSLVSHHVDQLGQLPEILKRMNEARRSLRE